MDKDNIDLLVDSDILYQEKLNDRLQFVNNEISKYLAERRAILNELAPIETEELECEG